MSAREGISRRAVLQQAAAVAAAGGTLALMEQLTGGISRAEAATVPAGGEQYLVGGLGAVTDNGVDVVIPPLYKYIFTARLRRDRQWTKKELVNAQTRLEKALQGVEAGKPRTAAGLTTVVAWGLPFFTTFIKPLIRSADWASVWPKETGSAADAVVDAVPFPSDPTGLTLEANEVMIMIRSDSPLVLDDVKGKLFKDPTGVGDLFDITSQRTGFVGRGFDKPSVARQLAVAANVPGAGSIPPSSQLMMGFTSTQRAALGPDNIASFETLALTSVVPGAYFAGGCAMHLSHIYEDLALWYGAGYGERVSRMFSARTAAAAGTVTLPNGQGEVAQLQDIKDDLAKGLPAGHNALLQQATRLPDTVTDVYGKVRQAGTPVPVREDFNTLDAPFTSSGAPQNRPGLHFVVFVPTSGRFHAARRSMDGHLKDGTVLDVDPRQAGINAMLQTTHRQNFLVPPRAHRSFPMAELLP